MTTLWNLQRQVVEVGTDVFGMPAMDSQEERLLRFAEEALELMRSCGLAYDMVRRLAEHEYAKEPGEKGQEVAGTALTLLALADSHDIDAERECHKEISRLKNNKEAIRAKAHKKPDWIFSTRPIPPEGQ